MSGSPVRIAVALAAVASFAAPAGAQTPLGPEFPVANPPGIQNGVSAAMQPQGGFVVAWTDQTVSGGTIAARRHDRLGIPVGAEFTLSTTGNNRSSVVGASGTGEFVAAWEHYPDGSGRGIVARRFDASGSPIGGEFQVNTVTANEQTRPSISVAPSGRFVVAWQTLDLGPPTGQSVQAQAFDAAGTRVGAELQVSAGTTRQYHSAVSMDATGAFIVAWGDKQRFGIYARRYDAGGQAIGGEFRVNTNSAASEIGYPSVAQGATGEFVVAWQRILLGPPPPFPPQEDLAYVNLQRFDATGARDGGEHQVPGHQARRPRVVIHPGGRSTLVWTGAFAPPQGVFVRRFDAAGRPVGPVDQVTTMNAGPPAIGVEDSSRFVIAWNSPAYAVEVDVWARLYDRLEGAGLAADAAPTPGSDGNGVVEAGETFTAAPAWANLHGSPVAAFGGSAVSFTGPGNSTYAILDDAAAYDAIPGAGTVSCDDAAPDCYRLSISVPGPRPAVHWDAALQEQLTPASEHGGRTWPVHVGESFSDVPRGSPFYRFVETLFHLGVTGGCTASTYCPTASTSREQMAVFALVGRDGAGSRPKPCSTVSPMFDDVPAGSAFCRWIEELARRGVVAGCGPRLYCPTATVSREQMAVFVLRTLEGTLTPPPCVAGSEMFGDVPASSAFCRWVEELARRGVVTGCGGGNYCPMSAVTREQMAVFIAVTFGLTLYGP